MRACWLKWVGRDWSISADYIWLNYSDANSKFKTYRAHRDAATPLPAVSLREKGGVLMGSGICRILPTGGSGSAGKNRDRPTRPRFYASATCGFVTENLVVLGGFRFFPALPDSSEK